MARLIPYRAQMCEECGELMRWDDTLNLERHERAPVADKLPAGYVFKYAKSGKWYCIIGVSELSHLDLEQDVHHWTYQIASLCYDHETGKFIDSKDDEAPGEGRLVVFEKGPNYIQTEVDGREIRDGRFRGYYVDLTEEEFREFEAKHEKLKEKFKIKTFLITADLEGNL